MARCDPQLSAVAAQEAELQGPKVAVGNQSLGLIKGNGASGKCKCVFSVVARLGDSESKTDAETIRAHGRMFFRPAHSQKPPPPPTHLPSASRLVIAHQSCRQSVGVDFIVRQLGAGGQRASFRSRGQWVGEWTSTAGASAWTGKPWGEVRSSQVICHRNVKFTTKLKDFFEEKFHLKFLTTLLQMKMFSLIMLRSRLRRGR